MTSLESNVSSFIDEMNSTNNSSETMSRLYPMSIVIPFTILYAVIFVSGLVGNISTCIVIARNKSMHNATNFYLFSLAISDLLLLLSGLPPEMYRIWSPERYIFGQAFCILQGFAAETSANASILTITAFTIERYIAICHPFLSQTMSKLSRAIRYIIIIWVVALGLAIPQAIQFGIEHEFQDGIEYSHCAIVSQLIPHAFEISTCIFFIAPMTLISVLYVFIGLRLRKSKKITSQKNGESMELRRSMVNNAAAQDRVVKMLIAVVSAFFICWAPFHAQRLLAVYLTNAKLDQEAQETFFKIYVVLMYISGVLYYLSTTTNPVLYHIMSNNFRKAFQKTFCSPRGGSTNGVYRRAPVVSVATESTDTNNHHRDHEMKEVRLRVGSVDQQQEDSAFLGRRPNRTYSVIILDNIFVQFFQKLTKIR